MTRTEEFDAGSSGKDGFYFNLTTGEVERGMVSSWRHRMGPYPTREAAQHALDRARERSEEWDADDRAWREGTEAP